MKLKEITEMCSRLPDGGIVNDRTRYDQGYLEMTVNVFSRRLLKMLYLKNRRINPVCYQKHWPIYEKDLQDDRCVTKFRHPEVVSLDDQSDGLRYAGTVDFANNYARIKSRGALSTMNKNRIMAADNSRRPTVLYDGNMQIIEVRGTEMLREIMTESILADPMSIPTFNKELDEYPFPNDLVPDLLQMIFSEETSIASSIGLPGKAGIGTKQPNRG